MDIRENRIEPDSSIPMYRQIVNIFHEKIEKGELKEGDKLPSEGELMKLFCVSRITIRAAVDELQEAGLVIRSRGKGTFISSATKSAAPTKEADFAFSCRQDGRRAEVEVLEVTWGYPTLADMKFFNLPEDANILRTRRLWRADGVPAMVETNHYISRFAFLQEEDLAQPLPHIMRKHRTEVTPYRQSLEIIYANQQEAALLQIDKGEALVLFMSQYMGEDGLPACISRQVYCTRRQRLYL